MEKKNIWGIIGLLFLMYCSASGNYINSGDEYLSSNSTMLGLIDLLICSIVMMIVPFIWRLSNKKRFNCVKGKKICKWNSIILFIVSIILMSTSQIGIIGGLGAVIYYFINKWLFVDEQLMPEDEYNNYDFEEDDNDKIECKNCGYIMSINTKKCPNCHIEIDEKIINDNKSKEEDNSDDIKDLENLYNEGILNVQIGNYQEAEKQLKKYIKEIDELKKASDEDWYTFNNCVELMLFAKENDTSEKKIVDVNYNSSNAYFYLSMIDFENKNYEDAIKSLNKSLKWNPNNVNALFEKAENYKANGDLKKYYSLTLDLFDKIYTLKDLSHYYRNLGYYFIENRDWDLAKAMYLYSVKFENNSIALDELKYILAKSKNEKLPAKEDLEDILKENRIPTYISKENIKSINDLYKKIVKEEQADTPVGKFLQKLIEELGLK